MSEYRLIDKATGDLIATVINLWDEHWTECFLCGKETPSRWGIPVNPEARIVPNNYTGEWAGVPACRECFETHRKWSERIALGVLGRKQ